MSFHHSVPCVMTSSEQFFVRVCACGVVHMSFGCTVVNVSSEAAVAIAETLREVTDTLRLEIRKRLLANPTSEFAEPQELGKVISGRFPAPQRD